jgi:Glyoxalase-like domain
VTAVEHGGVGPGRHTPGMTHLSCITAIVVDVPADLHEAESAFWGHATGHDLRPLSHDEYHGARIRPDLVLLVQRLGTGSAAVHVDIHTDDVTAEVARLESIGASVRDRFEDWTVMVDPAGLPFCVVASPEGTLDPSTCTEWP